MQMKDKLVKTNHKGSYYTMKKLSIGLLAVAGGAFVIAIPTYIMQTSKKNASVLAEEKTSERSESNSDESELNLEYEEYNDQEN